VTRVCRDTARLPLSSPGGPRLSAEFTGWRTLATSAEGDRLDPWSRAHLHELAAFEATWADHTAGGTLLHADIRAGNILITNRARS
jgi:Ser/Thr protein kinase RdoA (MazF antagonist)